MKPNKEQEHLELSQFVHKAYEEELPVLKEELIQKTLKAVQEEKQPKYGKMDTRGTTNSTMWKPWLLTAASILFCFLCVKLVQRTFFVKLESAADTAQMRLELWTGDTIETEGKEQESCVVEEGLSTSSTQESISEFITDNSNTTMDTDKGLYPNKEIQEKLEQEEDAITILVEQLPLLEKVEVSTEIVLELWIEGEQVEGNWEYLLEEALKSSPPQSLKTKSTFQSEDILFSIVFCTKEIEYCWEVGKVSCITIRQNGEEKKQFFEILDLTPYREILSIKL